MSAYNSTIRQLNFPVFKDARGVLVAIENDDPRLPFRPARSFLITDVPEGLIRAGHSHTNCQQLVISVRGSVAARLDDGTTRSRIELASPGAAVYLPAMTWLTLEDFSPGATLCVLASLSFDATRTIDDYGHFTSLVRHNAVS